MLRSYKGLRPRVAADAFVDESAQVIGDVVIGAESSVWMNVVMRGDVHWIRVGARTNLQDLCVVHVTRGRHPCEIGDEVTVGHRAVVHGCRVEGGALIGIGAVVLDGAHVGAEAVVGAGALVAPGARVEAGTLALGVPARSVRALRPEERRLQRERTLAYVETARSHAASRG